MKWNDLCIDNNKDIDKAFNINFNEYMETPYSDDKLFNSMIKSTQFRTLHTVDKKKQLKHIGVTMASMKGNKYKQKRVSVNRYIYYSNLF